MSVRGRNRPAARDRADRARDEQPGLPPWDTYAHDARSVPQVSALFAPWQLLVLPDALDGEAVEVS